MAMTFFSSTSTPLWSKSFTPHNAGEYAGICLFLIAFSTLFRFLLAVRVNFTSAFAAVKGMRYTGLGQPHEAGDKAATRAWRADEAVTTAVLDAVIAGASYLL